MMNLLPGSTENAAVRSGSRRHAALWYYLIKGRERFGWTDVDPDRR